jgi:endonuclease G
MIRKIKLLTILVVIIAILYLVYQSNQSKLQANSGISSTQIHYQGLREFYPRSNDNGQIVEYKAFSLLYNEKAEQASWVVYLLTQKMVKGKKFKRLDKFITDPNIETGSATANDYKRSGYDKGHLCPAADMAWDKVTERECFYMSNMSPQVPSFNRGIWKELEEQVRQWAISNDSIVIITGPILKNFTKTIGIEKVAVPDAYYKVIADISAPSIKTIAFFIPNKEIKSSISEYAVTVDSVEKITGMDLFHEIPAVEQTENKAQLNDWK